MSEIALYRKYRPTKFKDVLGQDHITSVINGEIQKKTISHAYLFTGTRGTGKTSVARILASSIGCKGNDLYEIDAASNRGIDDIRDLRESVNTLPFESPYKVYIIDEVHMLTKEAFNALLKTLEEPPEYVVFVLATTEIHKLPETVVSRCEIHNFKKPSSKTLMDELSRITKKEGFELEPLSLELIALLGDGSFRDAIGMLQKIIRSSSDKKISIDEVEKITGAPKSAVINEILEKINEKDLNNSLKLISKIVDNNVNIDTFLKLLLHKIRTILLLRFAKDLKKVIKEDFSDEDFELLDKIAEDKNSGINSVVLKELIDSFQYINNSSVPQLPIELALIKIFEN